MPHRQSRKTRHTVGVLLSGIAGVLLVAPLLTPILPQELGHFIHAAYGSACHQIPERTFHISGVPLAICQRCTGIYLGILIGMTCVLMGWRQPGGSGKVRIGLLIGTVVLLGIDWLSGFQVIGLSGVISRFITGLFFGIVAGSMLGDALLDLSKQKPRSHKNLSESGSFGPTEYERQHLSN